MKKVITILLTIQVLVLSGVPCISDAMGLDCCTENCSESESCDDCACCSPFFHCSTCHGFPIPVVADYEMPANAGAGSEDSLLPEHQRTSRYITSVWRPPIHC